MKITIAIPNFNGENLLEKNLPNIIKAGADEVIVLDDCSKDSSLELLQKLQNPNNKLQTNSKFKILKHKKNKGFIPSVNELFIQAEGEMVILLNNDVYVEKEFIKPLIKHFENPKVFAVNLHEEGEGPAISFWKDGFYEFKRGKEAEKIQKSAWASGGSAAFRKSVWQELGGFDDLFAPFYWEDIDISFRAIKVGYEILWEPGSRVKHDHETTIKKAFSEKYIRWVQQRNQLLYIWKNITDSKLKSEHRNGLIKRLFNRGAGYWIPFLWAVLKSHPGSHEVADRILPIDPIASLQNDGMKARSDLDVINYASS